MDRVGSLSDFSTIEFDNVSFGFCSCLRKSIGVWTQLLKCWGSHCLFLCLPTRFIWWAIQSCSTKTLLWCFCSIAFRFNDPNRLLQWGRSPGKKGSHFDPSSDLFLPNERNDIITSTACWTAMLALLGCLSFVMGPVQILKLYGVPYVVCLVLFVFEVFLGPTISMKLPIVLVNWLICVCCFEINVQNSKFRFLLCGWTWSLTCIIMAMRTNFHGTVER